MPAPPKIYDLVTRFQDNLDAYRAGQYNETQVRREFIDPFLKALGWDVDNEQGYAEAYKDVVHEDAIRISGAVKAPDYSCRIGGQRKFFVEAKKPAVNIKEDIHPAYQLRRYAWSAKLPLSILTDFEEFAVYDCRVKPEKNDKASAARLMYFRFSDYAERWDEIAAIFSPQAIRKGSFDKFVHEKKGQRGTAEVDTAFLQEISHWRDELAANIALRNKERKLKSRNLSFAVQSTIDRLIFLRIAEDRGIEPYGKLRDMAAGKEVYSRLADAFRLADAKYNSGLFHFGTKGLSPLSDGRDNSSLDTLTLSLAIDDKVLKGIIGRLYYPDSPYQFDVIPADILGQVYEQFLGKVIRLTVRGQAKVEEKPEVKKAGGVYYTPTYIVQYIVQQTVGKLLAGKTPAEVSQLTILDPACGSGSFLLGAYQFLLDWHLTFYSQEPEKWLKGRNPAVFAAGQGNLRLTIGERKRILLNNLYGVDIDPQAVEVTKLSLLLKVLEGETAQTIGPQMALLPERVLPDLSRNIQCGNSLIGPDFYDEQQMGLAGIADEEELYRVNAFDWQTAFPDIMARGGFDAVIGNPPYVRSIAVKNSYPQEWTHYRSTYQTASAREWDIYLIFVEKALSLLKPHGLLGYILPNKFLNSQVGENLREILSAGHLLEKLVHFEAFQIFQGATTYTCLLFLNKEKAQQAEVARYRGEIKSTDKKCALPEEAPDLWQLITVSPSELGRKPWEFGTDLLTKLKQWPGLGSVAEIFKGTGTNADKVYTLEKRGEADGLIKVYSAQIDEELLLEPAFLKPVLRGRSIGRYEISGDLLLVVPYLNSKLVPAQLLAREAPRTFEYLKRCRTRLDERENGRFKGDAWYQYGRPQNLHRFEVSEKIVFPDVAIRGTCFLDRTGYWLLDTAYGVAVKPGSNLDLRYLLAILNSPLLTYFLKQAGTPLRGGYFRMKTAYLEPFPVRLVDFSKLQEKAKYEQVIGLVEQNLSYHQRLAEAHTAHEKTLLQRQITTTDRQIDQLVYQLYNLTPEEIALVEGV